MTVSLFSCASLRHDRAAHAPRLVPVGEGWARNAINTVTFRQNAVTTHKRTQYTAYYDAEGYVVLAKRRLGSRHWHVVRTTLQGKVRDSHNSISIGVDGAGFLHVAWDHHAQPLNYARSVRPGSLELTERLGMTGQHEDRVTYPEFFNLDNGDLLFLYRDGSSGSGDTMLNRYDVKARAWRAVQHPLITGEGLRNAYTNQIAIDRQGRWRLSWNWRETGDVATNHDLCYAVSDDEGRTWRTSTGLSYTLPIKESTAEVVCAIPQNHELINQVSMTVDSQGRPIIATYWRPEGAEIPQYHVVWHDGAAWRVSQVGRRTTPFTLSGGGARRIPISRPKVAVDRGDRIYFLFRDEERGNVASVAICDDLAAGQWRFIDLTKESLNHWEPTYDMELWKRRQRLHLFVQHVGQGDAETLEDVPPQPVSILEWEP